MKSQTWLPVSPCDRYLMFIGSKLFVSLLQVSERLLQLTLPLGVLCQLRRGKHSLFTIQTFKHNLLTIEFPTIYKAKEQTACTCSLSHSSTTKACPKIVQKRKSVQTLHHTSLNM